MAEVMKAAEKVLNAVVRIAAIRGPETG